MTAEHLSSQVREAPQLSSDLRSVSWTAGLLAGSHKIDPSVPSQEIIDAAVADWDNNVHQVVAPAGSVLCFHESLLHASGRITSGRDRLLVISGWSPCHYQPCELRPVSHSPSLRLRLAGFCADHAGFEPNPALLERVTPDVAALLSGSQRWGVHRHSGPHGHPMASQLGDRPGPRL